MGVLAIIWQAITSLPALLKLIDNLVAWWATHAKDSKDTQNKELQNEVESAKSPEEKQKAVNDIAGRWGKQ